MLIECQKMQMQNCNLYRDVKMKTAIFKHIFNLMVIFIVW